MTRTDVVSGAASYFLTDALGSPIAVTDSAGAVQTEYIYEPFGKTKFSGASNSSSYQYTGRENDGTGLYYYRTRYYHPQLQRFISEDPIEFQSGDVNLYAYVINNPLLYLDPFGLVPGACRDPNANCGPSGKEHWDPPPKSSPPPPKPPEPDPPPTPIDNCQGCYTDRGKVYDSDGEPVQVDPGPQRFWGDGAKIILRYLFGAREHPDY